MKTWPVIGADQGKPYDQPGVLGVTFFKGGDRRRANGNLPAEAGEKVRLVG